MSGTWRSAIASGVAAVAVAVAVVASAVGVWFLLRDHADVATRNSGLDYADREVAWSNGWTPNQEALYAARSHLHRDGDYDVLVGPPERFEEQLTANSRSRR